MIEDFEQAISQQNMGRGGHRANSVAIDAALNAADKDLERLDTAFKNKFASDPATLAAWQNGSRVQSAPRQQKTPTTPTPPATPTQ